VSEPGEWIPLSEHETGMPRPSAMRFWDGSERTVNRWHEILTCLVEKLYSEEMLRVEHVPIQWSRHAYSVHSKPVGPTGKSFAYYKEINGAGLFVNVNLNLTQLKTNTRKLLQRYGKDPSTEH